MTTPELTDMVVEILWACAFLVGTAALWVVIGAASVWIESRSGLANRRGR